jgi:hypothetical protein
MKYNTNARNKAITAIKIPQRKLPFVNSLNVAIDANANPSIATYITGEKSNTDSTLSNIGANENTNQNVKVIPNENIKEPTTAPANSIKEASTNLNATALANTP